MIRRHRRRSGSGAAFANRVEAGRRLAEELAGLRGQDAVVLGLPRGGVPVAAQVAAALDAPLDVIVVRKLGVPVQPELAMGAIGEDGVRVLDDAVIALAGVTDAQRSVIERRERVELDARVARLRRGRPRLDLAGRTAVIVDDGIATGSTARAACRVARHLGAARVIMAAPVAAATTIRNLTEADEVRCVVVPGSFLAVGAHYDDFAPVTDDEVVAVLDAAARRRAATGADARNLDAGHEIAVPCGTVTLAAQLRVPADPHGVVVFAHGSGSSRHSPRNGYVAGVLHEAGFATLLLDLLTPAEEGDRSNVFDVELLAARLAAATAWVTGRPELRGCEVGYFGASTGAAAALWAAAADDSPVRAVVSRGGRPDLAGPRLAAVRAPTLLVVGGADPSVLALNRRAQAQLRCANRLRVVAGAGHLFEEPGTLTEAATLARDWFAEHLHRSGRPVDEPSPS